jgi:glycine oxidase
MQSKHYDVVIVGAGVVGCAVAYYVARSGMQVAIVDKERVASEASQASAGMLAPLPADVEEYQQPSQRLFFAALQHFDHLDQELRHETGIDIELVDAPTLRLAFDEQDVAQLQVLPATYQQELPGLRWLERSVAREIEPLLPETILGALLSPPERNLQGQRLTLALARGATLRGADLFEGRPVGQLIRQEQRVVGIETAQGPLWANAVVLATGAWLANWHTPTVTRPLFPVKGQMIALQPPSGQVLRHTLYTFGGGCIVPKADGSISVGATSEHAGFDKTVTAEGISKILSVQKKMVPALNNARFLRAWAGLRPGSVDDLPLIGPSQSTPGLWIAGGHYRDGILLGPLTGSILAQLLQGYPIPSGLDLTPFDPDRFGGWDRTTNNDPRLHLPASATSHREPD